MLWLFAAMLACAPKSVPETTLAEAAVSENGRTDAIVGSVEPGLRLRDVDFPGDRSVAAAGRTVLGLWLELHPDLAADAGLLGDGLRLPSYAPAVVQERLSRLDSAAATLAQIDESALAVADRIDLRLLQSAVAQARHALVTERRWTHRPAEWLEPVGTLLVAHLASPEPVPGATDVLAGQLPAMLDELRAEVTAPTARDVQTALGLMDGLVAMFGGLPASTETAAAIAALKSTRAHFAAMEGLPEMHMIGPESYRWRLKHALLLPWDAETLLARAEADLAAVNAEIAALEAQVAEPAPATDAERAMAAALDQDGVLALYDTMVSRYLTALQNMDVLTVPEDLPPIRARPTPEALIPLTGDGGSMNPVAQFGPTEGAWWNVEHFDGALSEEERLSTVLFMNRPSANWFGPYAVHEGVPGHHLQLSIARDNPRPVRKLLQSTPLVEGWALYAEGLFEGEGGFGGTSLGRLVMLRSYRARIKRVVFDVKVETGVWTLQEAADWKHDAKPGEGTIGPELLRTVQWPTQLIGYYAGREEIEVLREDCRGAWGDTYSDRRFHDALLAEGPIPVSLVRLALLGDDA